MSLHRTIRLGLLVLGVAWLCLATRAFADDAKARARTLFNQGVAEFEAGEHRAALQSFETAYRLAPHPTVRVNMANCFEQLGRFVEAKFNYERFLEESGESVSEEQRADVEAALARLSAQIGTLVVRVEPVNAVLKIDGQIPKRLPSGAVQLPTGRYEVSLSADGYLEAQRTIMIEGQKEETLNVTLEPVPDSTLVAEPAPAAEPMVQEEEPPPVDDAPDASADKPRYRTWMWVAAGSTAAFVVGMGVTGGLSLAAKKQFDDQSLASNDPSRTAQEREAARADGFATAQRADRLALASDIFLVSSVVAGGATLLFWLTDRKAERRAAMRAGPMVLKRGGGGLVLGGKF